MTSRKNPSPDADDDGPVASGNYSFVVVASRLPVDRGQGPDGETQWRPSPGGLVTALEPVIREAEGAWVGWSGDAGPAPEEFDAEGMHLVGVGLSATEMRQFYEGFCNATLWPLYHDVIAPPEFHRSWWEAYVTVNRRFARAAAGQAAPGATVWVHDYQLQLVPRHAPRAARTDVRIGFFNHIPFPGYEIFAQLPWRRQIVEGLLGADLLGFQRQQDATNFLRACRRAAGLSTRGSVVRVPVPVPGTASGPPGASVPGGRRRAGGRRGPPGHRRVAQAALGPGRGRAGQPRGPSRRVPDLDRLRGPTRSWPPARTVRERAEQIRRGAGRPGDRAARRRPARLHQGHPAPAPRLRRAAGRRPAERARGGAGAGGQPQPGAGRALPALRDEVEVDRGPDQRRARRGGPPARALPAPVLPPRGDGRAVPGRRRDAGDLRCGTA